MIKGLIVDNFAGGGGASTGIEMATGRSVDIAINHDENAIAMHTTNHPDTLHYCESVFDIDPVTATAGRPVDLAWFSPDCRHFSKAKGGTPVKKEIRGLAWIVIRWALRTGFRCGMLENVEEFKTWGPLIIDAEGKGYPCPARKGETFKAFVEMLSTGISADHPALGECCEVLGIPEGSDDRRRLVAGLGYNVDYRELRANLIGTPTIRKRFFMVIRRDGQPIRWPAQTHDHRKSAAVRKGQFKAEPTTADCIDWSISTRSIFGRKKDLADNTLRRIVKGIHRFVLDCADPFIVQIGQTGFGGDGRQYSTLEPLTTVTSKAEHLLIEPFVVKCNHTSNLNKYDCFRGHSGRDPLQTVTRTHGFAIAAPVVVRQFGKSTGQRADEAVGTVMPGGGGKTQLASALLVGAGGPAYSGKPRSVNEPMITVPTASHTALCSSHLVQLRGTCRDGKPTRTPAPTLTASGNHIGHVQAFLTKYYGTASAVEVDGSAPAVTTKDRLALTEAHCDLEPLSDEQRYGAWWCARLMDKFSDVPDDNHLFPAPRLQYLRVGDYIIVDICMRMLEPRELYRAQGFPDWYIIDRDYRGKKYSKAQQVARCGNAVPPPFAEALVRANLPELCVAREEEAA
ncbi:DNA cytosine methyltransferase [Serratia plymuthica]|nr:DNA cytosine methyltransferase [Serratia plymuthica]MBL3524147.1 DNA cytosine methyltransferase [Serratia plymuthica]